MDGCVLPSEGAYIIVVREPPASQLMVDARGHRES